jgi:DNA helicase II / ATP-dependent DNA helicase PcrA
MPLTEEQLIAIQENVKNKILFAGPGTGKSFTLKKYIKDLIEEKGVSQNNIFVLTFTRSSKFDLIKDIKGEIKEESKIPAISTLHGFALRCLMKNKKKISSLPTNFKIADTFEEENIIKEDLKKTLGISKDDIDELFRRLSANWETLNADSSSWETDFDNPNFLGAWKEHRKIYGYVLRSELVYQFKKMLDEIENVKFDDEIKYLIVDEYQDLNKCDLSVIHFLNKKFGSNLFCSGDDDQSIYQFRYAFPEGIRNFTNDIKDSKEYYLSECKRCDSKILDLALQVIRQDLRRRSKSIKSVTGNEGVVTLLRFKNQFEEAKKISNIILELNNKGIENKDILILLRNDRYNAFSKVLIEEFNKIPISSFKVGNSLKKLNSNEGKKFLSIIKYLIDNENDLAIRSIMECANGIGAKTFEYFYEAARTKDKRFYEVFKESYESGFVGTPTQNKLKDIFNKIEELRYTINNNESTFFEYINKIFIISDIYEENIKDLILEIIKIEEIKDFKDFLTFIEDLLGPEKEPEEYNKNSVRIMTMHQAKGLTAKAVFVVAAEDEYLPGKLNIDEERRLLYVSLTRARNYLFVTFCNDRLGQQEHTGKSKGTARTLTNYLRDLPSVVPEDGNNFSF